MTAWLRLLGVGRNLTKVKSISMVNMLQAEGRIEKCLYGLKIYQPVLSDSQIWSPFRSSLSANIFLKIYIRDLITFYSRRWTSYLYRSIVWIYKYAKIEPSHYNFTVGTDATMGAHYKLVFYSVPV